MRIIGEIDLNKYQSITPVITTNAVVVTGERVEHIKERHPGDWESYNSFARETVADPDFILIDKNPNTAICIKRVVIGDEIKHLRATLRLHTPEDEPGRANSILTFQKISQKEYGRLTRNKKVVYRKE